MPGDDEQRERSPNLPSRSELQLRFWRLTVERSEAQAAGRKEELHRLEREIRGVVHQLRQSRDEDAG
jgi:hypothetical protein